LTEVTTKITPSHPRQKNTNPTSHKSKADAPQVLEKMPISTLCLQRPIYCTKTRLLFNTASHDHSCSSSLQRLVLLADVLGRLVVWKTWQVLLNHKLFISSKRILKLNLASNY